MRKLVLGAMVCGLIAFWATAGLVSEAQTLTTLVDFNGTNGSSPSFSALVQGTDGNFYGTTVDGGLGGRGTVFRMSSSNQLTTLWSFLGPYDGINPRGGLVQGSDGNFYGTTSLLGTHGRGTVFKITRDGMLTPLYSFSGSDGAYPESTLVLARDGNFYGTTRNGGTDNNCFNGCGTIFRITPAGVLTTLHSFSYISGHYPVGALVQAIDGNLYGTTNGDGFFGSDMAFKISIQPPYTLTPLHVFDFYSDGGFPNGGLVQAADGYFYGTAEYGGSSSNCSFDRCGTVFKMTPDGQLTPMHSFAGTDGGVPIGPLVLATDGTLYGTTEEGGTGLNCTEGCGTVFQIIPESPYTLTTLYNFDSADGANPNSGLLQVTSPEFYGTTAAGGSGGNCMGGCGTIFSLSLPPVTLSVSKTGNGTVISGDGYIYCGEMCSYLYIHGTRVGLVAVPAPGYTFSNWTGCDNVQGDVCVVAMSSARDVTATFDATQITLTSLTFKPSYVKGGQLSAGTLTLSGPAPSGGLGVALSSDHPNVAHPPSLVLVPGGKSSIVFGVNTFPVKTNTTVMITATAGASQVSGTLTVGTGYSQSAK